MPSSASSRLNRLSPKIMDLWVQRALAEVSASKHQEDLALRNSLPIYLTQLSDALSKTIDRTAARNRRDRYESTFIGNKHGRERAVSKNYTMDQLIFEYHILREVICDVMEEEKELSAVEREVIISSIEQAVNDAATQFARTLREIQEQLTNTLAHDFRTPLTVAKMNLQLILRNPDDADHVISKASQGVTNLERLDRLIQNLLDGSRMKAGSGLTVELSKGVDLNVLIQEVMTDLSTTHKNRMIYKAPGKCLGLWNESGLRRVIENLATNAVKYGYDHTPITITLTQSEDKAVFSVHNQGAEIPEDEVSMLFQQFRRLRTAEDKPGWGLGLSVVKGMVEAHHGEIEVESVAGKGTTFTITVPKNPQAT